MRDKVNVMCIPFMEAYIYMYMPQCLTGCNYLNHVKHRVTKVPSLGEIMYICQYVHIKVQYNVI